MALVPFSGWLAGIAYAVQENIFQPEKTTVAARKMTFHGS